MSENTKIEWAIHSWNPWIGCTKVSPGCLNCYAEKSAPTRVARKQGRELWGKGNPRSRTSAAYWKQPLKWQRLQEDFDNPRPRVFPSLCDWLDDEVPIAWLADFLKLIHDTPNLDWLLLSKRPENWMSRLMKALKPKPEEKDGESWRWHLHWITGITPANVWIGTSVEDQKRADERIPELLKIPAAVRFLSVEPLLGPVDLRFKAMSTGAASLARPRHSLDWVIIGGESGPGARPCNVEWLRDIVRQCKAADVPCFVKQLGSYSIFDFEPGLPQFAGKLIHPKGGDPSEWPDDVRVREFPKR